MYNFDRLRNEIRQDYNLEITYIRFVPAIKESFGWARKSIGIVFGRLNASTTWAFFEVETLGDNARLVGVIGVWELHTNTVGDSVAGQVRWCQAQYRA